MRALFIGCLFAFIAPIMAGAAPITVVVEGTSTGGRLGDTVFSPDTHFTITVSSDTTGVESFDAIFSSGWTLASAVASIHIEGVGTADFAVPTHVFVNNVNEGVGFSRERADLLDLSCTIDCSTWDLTTSFGPVYNATPFYSGFDVPIETTLGLLTMDSSSSDVTFEAVVTPEPASGLLVVAGLTALVVRRR